MNKIKEFFNSENIQQALLYITIAGYNSNKYLYIF